MSIVCIFHSFFLLELIQVQTRLRGDEVDVDARNFPREAMKNSVYFVSGRFPFILARDVHSVWFPFGFPVISSICFG
jgi:hypothetical protein